MLPKSALLVLAFVMTVGLAGCSKPELNLLQENDVIVAFGDSLTAGYGVDKSQSYPAKLAEMTGLNVINAGVSGETTGEGLERLPQILEEYKPSLVILLEGGNDLLRKRKEAVIESNLRNMIQTIKAAGAEVILVGVPEKKLFGSSLPLYEKLADEFNIPLEEDIVSNLIKRPSMKSDYVHFNVKGYKAMAEAIFALMQDYGAIN